MKYIKYIIGVVLLFVAVWFSFNTESLKERNAREALKRYNPEQSVKYNFKNNLYKVEARAINLTTFLDELKKDPVALQKKHGRTLGIGSNIYYVVCGTGSGKYDNNEITFVYDGKEWRKDFHVICHIPTKYIFGNVARDASGWYDISTFHNTMDFNAVSACMNQYIKDWVVPRIVSIDSDDSFEFYAAIEVKPGQREVNELTLYPYSFCKHEIR